MRTYIGRLIGTALIIAVGVQPAALANHQDMVDKLDRGSAEVVSLTSTGGAADANSGTGEAADEDPCMDNQTHISSSDNGRIVAFASRAGNLHPADVNGGKLLDVFALDRKTDELKLVSGLPSGLSAVGEATSAALACRGSFSPSVSGNGRYVAFVSNQPLGDDQVQAATPDNKIFVHDLKTSRTELVSATWNGLPALGASYEPTISDNGRLVAFISAAPNLIEEDACINIKAPTSAQLLCAHVYVRDVVEDQTTLVSKTSSGEPANLFSLHAFINGSGRYVVFDTGANNLVENDDNMHPLCFIYLPNTCPDVFRHDLQTGDTELVSVSRDGSPGNLLSELPVNHQQAISDDGQVVIFSSGSSDLVPANPPTQPAAPSNAFVRDFTTGRTERVSVSSAGVMLFNQSRDVTISDDGQFVTWFGSTCEAHESGGTPSCNPHWEAGLFEHDRRTGQADWVKVAAGGARLREAPEPHSFLGMHLGGNGRFLIEATQFTKNGKNGHADVYIRDLGGRGGYLTGAASPWRAAGVDRANALGRSAVTTFSDPPDDSLVAVEGSEILETTLAYRPELRDLFVRIEMNRMDAGGFLSPILYGARLAINGVSYEVRAGLGQIALYRCEAICSEVSKLHGGIGTTGERVTFSIPAALVGLEGDARLDRFEAFTGLGNPLLGPTSELDVARLN